MFTRALIIVSLLAAPLGCKSANQNADGRIGNVVRDQGPDRELGTADISVAEASHDALGQDLSQGLDLANADAAWIKGCPPEMVRVDAFCIDPYEAPNKKGALPLVMYTFDEAAAWCKHRDKRLCFDDEWSLSCATATKLKYPYGNTHQPGTCNDNKIWKVYSQTKLSAWPRSVARVTIATLADLFAAAKAVSTAGVTAAAHVQSLYQGTPSGSKTGCANAFGVYDLCGNVEEWTRRRDGGSGAQFLGNLKGRYWAEARTCQSGVKSHGNGFRFYEIGFRCCKNPIP